MTWKVSARRRVAALGTTSALTIGLLFAGAAVPAAAVAQDCPGMAMTLSSAADRTYGFGVDDDFEIRLNGTPIYVNNDELAELMPPFSFIAQTGDQLRIIASNSTVYGGNAYIESLALWCDANTNVQVLEAAATNPPNIGIGEVFFDKTYTIEFTDVDLFDFSGFLQPIDNLPTVNGATAGRSIPVKFSLDGDQGLDIFADGYPKSQTIACSSTAEVDGVEVTTTAGSSSLSYDPVTDQYTYVWKTEKSWAGTCRQLVVKLSDGTLHRANFQFK